VKKDYNINSTTIEETTSIRRSDQNISEKVEEEEEWVIENKTPPPVVLNTHGDDVATYDTQGCCQRCIVM